MGAIDLDPASCDAANEVVKAATYYTIEDDGLAQEWVGRVWMNPPYATGLIQKFTAKLRDSFDSGAVSEAIAIVNNATETRWFQHLLGSESMVCFPTGRVRFWKPNPEDVGTGPLQGQAILYLGDMGRESFASRFSEFGRVFVAWS